MSSSEENCGLGADLLLPWTTMRLSYPHLQPWLQDSVPSDSAPLSSAGPLIGRHIPLWSLIFNLQLSSGPPAHRQLTLPFGDMWALQMIFCDTCRCHGPCDALCSFIFQPLKALDLRHLHWLFSLSGVHPSKISMWLTLSFVKMLPS